MKFNEFYNRQKNVIKTALVKRIESDIQITEERDAFYKGELFSKYDIVESDGKQYTILEQASNYYQVVDESGNIFRKFPKQLKKLDKSFSINITESFHGYVIRNQEVKDYLAEHYFVEAMDNDDVGILKHIKYLDEQMDNSYKAKDKLTVAKIIADAVGVPYDVVSNPDNLVSAAIRKAKKDPALMKNKAILANMLQIAKEVGIKIADDTFVSESKELVEFKAGDKVKSIYGTIHTVAVHDHTGQVTMTDGKVFHPTKVKLIESEELVEYLDKDRHSEYALHHTADKAVVSNKKYKVKHRATGKVISVHNNALDAVRAMKNAGHSNDTHSIVKESSEGKHRISVTVSDPNHSAVSQRKEQIQKFIKVSGSHTKESALDAAKAHYKKRGYKVHGAEHVGMVTESTVQELDEGTLADLRKQIKDLETEYREEIEKVHSRYSPKIKELKAKQQAAGSKVGSAMARRDKEFFDAKAKQSNALVGYRNHLGESEELDEGWKSKVGAAAIAAGVAVAGITGASVHQHMKNQEFHQSVEQTVKQKSPEDHAKYMASKAKADERHPTQVSTWNPSTKRAEIQTQYVRDSKAVKAHDELAKELAKKHGVKIDESEQIDEANDPFKKSLQHMRKGDHEKALSAVKDYPEVHAQLKKHITSLKKYTALGQTAIDKRDATKDTKEWDRHNTRAEIHSDNAEGEFYSAAALLNKHAGLHESEQIEELSIGTLQSYSQKAGQEAGKLAGQGAKAKKTETAYEKFKKASTRLDGKAKADKKVFKKEWNSKVGISEEIDVTPDKDTKKEEMPHGHTLNPTSETHRKQLIKKITGK